MGKRTPGSGGKPDPNERLLRFSERGGFGRGITLMGEGLLPPDTWLIHFSDDAVAIATEGFTRGTPLDAPDLGYAFGAGQAGPGFNFAFLADDEFSLRTLVEYDFGGGKDQAVMFRSSGVAMWHYGDFGQVCFWGPSVRGPFVRLVATPGPDNAELPGHCDAEPHDRPWSVLRADGSVAFTGDDLFAAIDAVLEAARLETGRDGPDRPGGRDPAAPPSP